MPPGEKQSGKQTQNFWAYSQKVVRTKEIVRSLITSLSAVKGFISTWVFRTGFGTKCSRLHCHRRLGLETRLQTLAMYYSVLQATESSAGVWKLVY